MIRHNSPLQWPIGWPKTESWSRKSGGFQVSYEEAANQLADELERLGASDGYLSTDQPVRISGSPDRTKQPNTPGVALYFERNNKQLCIPCDRFNSVRDNIRAIGLTLEAVRRMERYGTSQMVEAALSGFTALPANAGEHSGPRAWYEVLGVAQDAPKEVIRATYRTLTKTKHPDAGGSPEEWDELRRAYEQSGASS